MTRTGAPSTDVVADVAPKEADGAVLGELADVHEFVGEQFTIAAAVAILAQQDDGAEGQPVGSVGQEGHLHEADPLGEVLGEDVVGEQFGAFEAAHRPRVRVSPSGGDDDMVSEHYARVEDLTGAIIDGLGPESPVTIERLAAVDEFHLGGARATDALVADLGLIAGQRVLDIGCGIGGPARRMAATAGCDVLGVDLTPSFVATATELSRLTGLGDRTEFVVGDATALSIDEQFDAATLIHVGMNIPDKPGFFAAIAPRLRPGARFAVYDIMAVGDTGGIGFPMPFASSAEHAFVASPAEYGDALAAAGFSVGEPEDRTQLALEAAAAAGEGGPPPVSLATLMGPDFGSMFANLGAALRAGQLAPVQIIATR